MYLNLKIVRCISFSWRVFSKLKLQSPGFSKAFKQSKTKLSDLSNETTLFFLSHRLDIPRPTDPNVRYLHSVILSYRYPLWRRCGYCPESELSNIGGMLWTAYPGYPNRGLTNGLVWPSLRDDPARGHFSDPVHWVARSLSEWPNMMTLSSLADISAVWPLDTRWCHWSLSLLRWEYWRKVSAALF